MSRNQDEGLPTAEEVRGIMKTNFPPTNIETVQTLASEISDFLKEHPVIEGEDALRTAKPWMDRARLGLADLDAERKGRKQVFQKEIDAIEDEYRTPRTILQRIYEILKDRVTHGIRKEEEIRRREAEEARKRVEEAEKAAREAEQQERESIADASSGVESDVGSATRHADAAFSAFKRAEREAARAEKATDVKVGGGFSRAISTRFKETLVVEDPLKAISIMGWSERLFAALITDAREYRKRCGQLPHGIISQGERKV